MSQGGLGIRLATDLALPAFLASACGSSAGADALLHTEVAEASYQPLTEAKERWDHFFQQRDPLPFFPAESLQPENESVQVLWDAPLFKAKYSDLLEKQPLPAERARLKAVASEHSSDWLNAIPISKIGLKLDRTGIRIACGLRLGAPLGLPHRCPCGEMVTELGRHGIS